MHTYNDTFLLNIYLHWLVFDNSHKIELETYINYVKQSDFWPPSRHLYGFVSSLLGSVKFSQPSLFNIIYGRSLTTFAVYGG